MKRAALVLGGVAAAVAATDLAHKAAAVAGGEIPAWHERSALYGLGVVLACAAWSAAIAATRSVAMAAAAGVIAGGGIGNAASLALWPAHDGVPNPLLWSDGTWGIAYNLADVFVTIGLVLLIGAASVFALRNRGRLRDHVI